MKHCTTVSMPKSAWVAGTFADDHVPCVQCPKGGGDIITPIIAVVLSALGKNGMGGSPGSGTDC